MKHKKSSLKAVLSVAMAASMLAQTGLQTLAAAYEATSDPFDSEKVAIFETDEPSRFGYTPYRIVDEDGNEIEMELTPDMSDLGSYAAGLPTSYDLRDYGLVTSVKNQNPTGTCWAHAAMASGESMLIKDGLAATDIDLSEAHLVWFSIGSTPTDVNDPLYHDGYEEYNLGTNAYNNGGNSYISAGTLSSWVGAAPEADYANVATSPTLSEADRYDSIYHLQNAYLFDGEDRDIIKSYLMNNGALTISYYHDDMFYNSSNYAYYCNIADPDTSTGGGHAVTIVGWDDSFSKSNFPSEPEGDGAWLIKNSWGTWWGDEGYFWISYYDKNIDDIRSIELEPTTNYTDIYQYAGVFNTFYYNDNYNGNMGVIFTSDSNDPISAVSFQTTKASTPYEIRIYSGSEYGKPLSGTLVHTQTGTATYAGLQTIKLDKLISVPSGTNFSVFIHMAKNGSSVAVDDNSSTTGRCYYGWGSNMDSVTWKDMGKNYNYDIHIKAYTSTAATPKPTNLQATAGDAQVALTWDAVENATKYAVYYGTDADNLTAANENITANSYTVTGLTNGTKYYFAVKAYANGYWSALSTAISATPTAPVIPVPANVKATAGDAQVALTWDAVENATKYAVYYGTDAANLTAANENITANSFTVTSLTNGTKYYFAVKAYANGYWSDLSTAVSATPAAPVIPVPANVKATAGDAQVALTWDAVENATKYAVYYGTDADNLTAANENVTANSYTVTGLTNGTKYYFAVKAYANGYWSALSAAVSATPVSAATPKPTNIKATAGNGQVTLTWDKVNGATKYAVALYDASTKKYTVKTDTLTTNSYTVTGLTNGTTYYFLVQAYANGKWSTFTTADHVSATPAAPVIPVPTNVKATAGDAQVALTWDAVENATKYAVYYGTDAAKLTAANENVTANSFTVTGLTNGTKYYFAVKAYANGYWSALSTAVSATPAAPVIPVPTNVKATAGDGQVTITWDAATGATKYQVYYSADGGASYTKAADTTSDTSYTVKDLENGTEYLFAVRAYSNGKWYGFSDAVSATPVSAVTPKPTNIKATAGDGKVTLTWDKVTGATKYAVALYDASTKKYTVKTNTLTTNSYTVTGLTNGTTYYFLVQAYANGKWSTFTTADHVSATPVGATTTKPTNIKAVAGDGKVTLTWDKVTGATKYCVALYDASTKKYTVKTNTLTTNSYTVTGLTNGTTYYFLVQAYANGAWSKFTTADHVSATPVGASTTKPTNIKAVAGDGKVTLTWDKVTGATKYCVALYNASTKKYTIKTNTLTTNSYTVTGLTNGTTYYFLVQAYANGAWSKFTTADHVSATPVGASTTKPTNIKAVAGDGKVTLTWDKVTGATKYCVALYNASTKKYTIKTNTLTTNSYTVTGLTNGTTYYFLVQAYANGKWSTFTTADHVSATPVGTSTTKPTNIKAVAGDSKVTLTWDKVDGATKYCVALYNASTKKYTIKTNTLTTNSYTVTGLTNGTTYYFLVQAYANGAWSKFSTADHVSATPVGVSTKPIVYSSIGDSQVALAWNAVSGATKYAIASYNASTGKYSVLTNTYTNTYCYIKGLVNDNTYRYLVQAYVNGKWSSFTTADLIVVTPKATAKPNVIATAGNGRGRLVWAAVTGATKYAVSRYYPATGKYTVLNDNWTSTNCELPNLTNGATYTYLVQAYVNGAWSKFSTADHVTITPAASSAFITAEEAGAAAYSDEQMDNSDLILDENNVLYQF